MAPTLAFNKSLATSWHGPFNRQYPSQPWLNGAASAALEADVEMVICDDYNKVSPIPAALYFQEPASVIFATSGCLSSALPFSGIHCLGG